jgi:hypothetical protein
MDMKESTHEDPTILYDATPYLKLFIDKDGRWFQNGAEIIHREIYKQFNQMLEKTPEGSYRVRLGKEICGVEVQDAPFVVLRVLEAEDGRLVIELNDGSSEVFNPEQFWIGPENVPYTFVKGRCFHARFSRPAYYQLARYITSENEVDFHLLIKGVSTPIKRLDKPPQVV